MHPSLSSIVTTFYLVALCNISVVRACGREDFEGVWHCEFYIYFDLPMHFSLPLYAIRC